jgi:Peptidase M16 inactive domain
MSLLHFAVAFKGVSWADADSIPLMIMQQMLGGWNKNAGAGANMASRASPNSACLHCSRCILGAADCSNRLLSGCGSCTPLPERTEVHK